MICRFLMIFSFFHFNAIFSLDFYYNFVKYFFSFKSIIKVIFAQNNEFSYQYRFYIFGDN